MPFKTRIMTTRLAVVWLLIVLLLQLAHSENGGSTCSHPSDLDENIKHIRLSRMSRSRFKRDANVFTENFTMTIDYDSSFNTGLSSEIRERIQNTVMPELKKFFQSVLTVRPLPGPIMFNRDCSGSGSFFILEENQYCASTCEATTECGTATVPTEYLNRCRECNDNSVSGVDDCSESGTDGPGADSTFVLLVSAKTEGSCPVSAGSGSTLAFAGSCEMEDDYDRPIAGFVNFCPVTIDGSQSDEYLLTVAKHEVLHALGFSSGLFQWWRDENGDPRSPRDADGVPTETSTNTVREVTYNDWSTFNGVVSHTVSLLVTPRIVEEGRRHFNCSTLEGVQLEDQGGSGTAGSHWEARITKGEGMNGVIATDGVFSRLTFALLEDSGWYKVDYCLAEQLIWGRGSGCEFTDGSCGGYIASQQQQGESISPFCDYPGSPASLYRCTLQRTGVSTCNLGTFNIVLPAEYQYFSGNNDGGSFETADFCPFQESFSNTMCADTGNTQIGLDNSLAQTFGPNSRCVEHGQAWRAQDGNVFRQQTFTQAGCYEYTCSNGQVTIHILDQSYVCTTAGEEISVSQTNDGVTYTGSIVCPSCLEICYDDFENCPEAANLYSEFAASSQNCDSVETTLDPTVLGSGNEPSEPIETNSSNPTDPQPTNTQPTDDRDTDPTRPSGASTQTVNQLFLLLTLLSLLCAFF